MEEGQLPEGWVQASVGEICRLINGRAYSKVELLSDGKYPLLRVGNLFTNPFWYYSDLELEPDKYCDKGDLLYAWSASFGPHIWQGPKVIYHYHIWKVEHHEGLIARDFLRAFFQWDTEAIKRDQGSGSTMLHVTKKSMEARSVPVPPRKEQAAIAAKLDTTLAAAEACRQRLDGVAAILKRFRQAVLAAATSGELTREWREVREEPGWETKALGECGAVSGGITKNSSRADMALQKSYIRVANVYANRLELDDISTIGVTAAEYQKTALLPGDLLIVEGNGSLQQVGRVAIWQDETLDCVHQNHLIRWRSCQMEPKWALYWLMSPVGRELLEKRAQTSTGLHTLSVSKVSGIPIASPSVAEQKLAIDLVDELFSLADQLEAKLTTARKVVERLTPALLAKAFRGELVPQDPNDEPASVLLERIRAARQVEAAAGKPSRRGRRKAAASPEQAPRPAAPVPPDLLAQLLQECGALSERALLAASELDPDHFLVQLELERASGAVRVTCEDGQAVLEGA
jgi:restriction endonuclease S subunit